MGINMIKKHGYLKLVAILLLASGSSLIPKQASAQVAVLCQACETQLPLITKTSATIATNTTAANAAFNKFQLYMTTGIGGSGSMSMGGGVIEQLQSLNDSTAEANQQRVQDGINSDLAARQRLWKEADTNINRTHMPSDVQRACVDATMAGGFSSGGGAAPSGGGSGAPNLPPTPEAAAVVARADVRDRNYSPIANAGSKMLAHTSDYCTAEDVKFKRLGCSAPGDYPGADTDASSLVVGAQGKDSKTTPLPVLDTKQTAVANAVINQVMPTIPAGIPAGANTSPQANEYNVDANTAKARISFADQALTDAIGMYSARTDLPAAYIAEWKEAANSDDFKRVYGANAKAPVTPSEYMVYDFEIMRKLTDPKIIGAESAKSPQAIAADQYKLQLIQAKLNLEQLAATKQNSRLLAILIAQSYDPQTAASLKSRLATLSNSGSASQ